jgi:hypothetical protein
MRFFKRGETADSKFTFLDMSTGEPIDVNNAQYNIVYYDGPNEIELVPWTPLDKLTGKVGEYVCSWEIPDTVPENETYFITATGLHPVDNSKTNIEDFYRVLPDSFFSGGGSGGAGGMVIKFTKP